MANYRLGLIAVLFVVMAVCAERRRDSRGAAAPLTDKAVALGSYAFLPIALAGDGSESDASSECRETWKALLTVDFGRYGRFRDDGLEGFELPRYEALFRRLETVAAMKCEATERMKPRLRIWMADFHRDCADVEGALRKMPNPYLWGRNGARGESPGSLCLRRALLYRFAVSGELYGTLPLSRIESIPLLFNLFYDEALDVDRSFQRLADLIARVQALAPRNYQAAKLLVKISFAYWGARPEGREVFDRAITYAEMLGKFDQDLVRLRMAQAARQGDAAKLRERIHQSEEMGLQYRYFLAWANYLEGDRDGAVRELRELFLSPYNWDPPAALALDRLLRDAPHPFTESSLSLGLHFLIPTEKQSESIVAGSVDTYFSMSEAYYSDTPETKLVSRKHDVLHRALDGCPKGDGWRACASEALDAWTSPRQVTTF